MAVHRCAKSEKAKRKERQTIKLASLSFNPDEEEEEVEEESRFLCELSLTYE